MACRTRAVAAYPVVDAFAVAAVELHASDDRVAGKCLDGVVVPLSGNLMLSAAIVASAAGIGRGNAEAIELVRDPLVSILGLKPLKDTNPNGDLAIILWKEPHVTAFFSHLDIVVELLDHFASSGITQKSTKAVWRPSARAVAAFGKLSLNKYHSLAKLPAELATLVVSEERHGGLAQCRLACCRWVDDAFGHHERHALVSEIPLNHHHFERVFRSAKTIPLEDEHMRDRIVAPNLGEHCIKSRSPGLAAAGGVIQIQIS